MNTNTFCSAPWFRIRIDWDGKFRSCCEINTAQSKFAGQKEFSLNDSTVHEFMTSDYLTYLRQELTQGNQLAECSRCWKKEANGVRSLRQSHVDTVTNAQGADLTKTWIPHFVRRAPAFDQYRITAADVKLSNVCNFSCVMCNPASSSKIYDTWNNNQDNKFVQLRLQKQPTYLQDITATHQQLRSYQHLSDILAQPIIQLQLLGGEPLLDKKMFNILIDQPEEKKARISLNFITNGSQNLVEAAEKLQGYKQVSFSISLEGIGAIQDWARTGSDWSQIEQNIVSAQQQGILVAVGHTIQAATVFKLPELVRWCQQHQLWLDCGLLTDPDYLSVSVLPATTRQLILDQFDLGNKLEQSLYDLITGLPPAVDLYNDFVEYVAWHEQDQPVKLRDICPEIFK
jgi:Radical SAM superfamily/4Fe-4S single cluster domain